MITINKKKYGYTIFRLAWCAEFFMQSDKIRVISWLTLADLKKLRNWHENETSDLEITVGKLKKYIILSYATLDCLGKYDSWNFAFVKYSEWKKLLAELEVILACEKK